MTTLETVIALLVSVLIAFVGFPFSSYQFWWSWVPSKTAVGTLLYLALVGVGGGYVGVALVALTHADLTSNSLVKAVLSGVAGALLLRSDVRPRARTGDTAPVPLTTASPAKQAASIVGTLVTYTSTSLDGLAKREAERWFTALDDVQLARQSLRLMDDLGRRSDCTNAFKSTTSKRVVEEIKNMRTSGERDAAKAHLVGFCTDYAASRQMAKMPSIG